MNGYFKLHLNKWIMKRFLFVTLIMILVCCIKIRLPKSGQHIINNNIFNYENIQYIIKNEICSDEIFLLVIIHSAPNHFHHRNLIRNTWGSPDAKTFSIKVVFLLAAAPEFQRDIERENSLHHDIIQGNFIDSYHNLTYKHAMGLRWVSENCSQAKYFMKMDDDIFVDIFQFVNYLNTTFTPYKLRKNIACFLQSGMPVVRDPVSKWYVSKSEYSLDVFENYCSGWAYLTTTNVANLLVPTVEKLNYFWIDDVHITGTAAKAANVGHIKINSLYDLESDGLVDWSNNSANLNWNKMFAPTWGDLVLSRKAYIKSLKCYVMQCECCYTRKTTPYPKQPSTTRKGVAKLLSI